MLLSAESAGVHAFMGERLAHDGEVRLRAMAGPDVRSMEIILDGCLVYKTLEETEIDLSLSLTPGRHYAYVRVFAAAAAGDLRPAWSSPVYLGEPE